MTSIDRAYIGELFKNNHWFLNQLDWNKSFFIEEKLEETPELNSLVKIVFVGDLVDLTNKEYDQEKDLLSKIIKAMKLKDSEFIRFYSPDMKNPDFEKRILDEISSSRPSFVITLGSLATKILLKKDEKLSKIHGQFFDFSTPNWNCKLVPIFHPDFLSINVNMKRAAWIDLQKIISSLE